MNAPSSSDESQPPADQPDPEADARQKKLAILNLFRLLETAVQTSQLKVGGQVVVSAQEIVGAIMSAKSEFEGNQLYEAAQGLRQAAEGFRYKTVRWESEARTAQARHSKLTDAQRKQLPAELSGVRTASRKTLMFFDRLVAALTEWASLLGIDLEKPTAVPTRPDKVHEGDDFLPRDQTAALDQTTEEVPPLQPGEVIDGFALLGRTRTDKDGITLDFSPIPTKQFVVASLDLRGGSQLEFKFRNASSATVRLQVQMFNAAEEPILSTPEPIGLRATAEKTLKGRVIIGTNEIDPTLRDARVVAVEFIDVPEDLQISDVVCKRTSTG